METLIHLRGVRLAGFARVPDDAIDWSIRAGERWALWGANGSGKSSLLSLLAGRTMPADGQVRPVPGLRVLLVPQEPEAHSDLTLDEAAERGLAELGEREDAVREEERRLADGSGDLDRLARLQEAFERAGGWSAPARLRRELAKLLPGRDGAVPVASLSTGERRRLALALAFAARPELLLLDEPTNGLDVTVRRWLATRLRRAGTSLVVASHDRALLSAVSTHSARLEAGRLEPVALPFDRDRQRRGVADATAARLARRARAEAARARQAATRARAWGTASAHGAARSLARRAAARNEAAVASPGGRRDGVWTLARADHHGELVLWARELAAEGVLTDGRVAAYGGDKIAVLGPNGSGKSTLLELLAGVRSSSRPESEVWTPPGLALHHWDAATRGLGRGAVIAQLERWVTPARARDLLALVRLPHERWSAGPDELSGGERSRAAVALTIAREPDLLLLDEPEADLDIAAIEALESALADASTTVILATHDLGLADAACDEVWTIQDGGVVAWRGGVAGWLAGRRRIELDVPARVRPEAASAPDASAALESLEDDRNAVEAQLSDPLALGERDRRRARARLARIESQLMAAYDQSYPAPLPRFRALEPPLELGADLVDGVLSFQADWPTLPRISLHGGIAHLVLPEPADGVWTTWARAAALRACAYVVFTALYPLAVQTRAPRHERAPSPYEPLDGDWWVLTRDTWERSRRRPGG